MRKSLFMMVVLSLCVADFGAFAAARRGGGTPGGAPVAKARAAAMPKAVNSNVAAQQQNPSVPNVNGGTRTRQKSTSAGGSGSAVPGGADAKAPGVPMAVRAAATKKAINMGTKVAAATENTVISQECQNAYYGCMDAFCMLDNASGGRCQCSDKITELDEILEQIMKLDEQSMRIATEGVETVEMGEFADQIKSRTKSIEGEITADGKKAETTAAKKKTLDLSAWNNSSLFDDDDFDFDSGTNNGTKIANDLSDKKGDDLHREAAKLCTTQLPTQCKDSASMLQMTYAQRIRSDCTGYENSLKQKKAESAQKLQTAQKAVRDAVLEDVKNKNKYTTEGDCVVAFDQCMQTTAKCGADYTGCVADDTVLLMDTTSATTDADRNKKVKTAQIKTSASAIGVSANTLAMLTDKAPICESVLKQCENVRKGVWASYLKMIAPTLKSAEVIAEQDRRMNCVNNIVECYKKGCAAQWPDEESADYDMCLSNPAIVGNICKPQIERCSVAGTGDQVMEYVTAKLASLRVDQCTKEIKQCLTSEDRCGADYSGCIGFDSATIRSLCPPEKLIACQTKFEARSTDDKSAIDDYIDKIAKGLSLQIDNNLLTTCQKAVDDAIVAACGDKTGCPNANISTDSVTDLLSVQLCKNDNTCVADPLAIASDEEVLNNTYSVRIKGKPEISKIAYSVNNQNDITSAVTLFSNNDTEDGTKDQTEKIVTMLNNAWKSKVQQIESDPKVVACIQGREIKDTKGENDSTKANEGFGKVARFANLTNSARLDIADALLNRLWEAYNKSLEQLNKDEVPALTKKLADRLATAAKNDEENKAKTAEFCKSVCELKAASSESEPGKSSAKSKYTSISASYNSVDRICTVVTKQYNRHWYGNGNKDKCYWGSSICTFVEDAVDEKSFSDEDLKCVATKTSSN